MLRRLPCRPTEGVCNRPYTRLHTTAGVLNDLGRLTELEERNGSFVIRGYSCSLAAIAPDHPGVCRMAETLLTELAGVLIYEHCDRGERPRCCFEIAPADQA
jgi:predicted ArsR family transcriptional regulator